MPPRVRMMFSVLMLALLVIPAVALYSALYKHGDSACAQCSPLLFFYAGMIGAILAILLVVVTGRLAYQGERTGATPLR